MWSWQSMSPGRIVRPATSMISASAGKSSTLRVVTASIRSSRMTIVAPSIGLAPVPSISRPPFSTFIASFLSSPHPYPPPHAGEGVGKPPNYDPLPCLRGRVRVGAGQLQGRPSPTPRRRLFISVGDAQHRCIGEALADDLERQGQPGVGEAAAYRHRRTAGHVERDR